MAMFSPEVKQVKSECWQSPFRVVARDESGRATHFVALSEREMMIAAVAGSVQIPDAQMPAAAIEYREKQRALEEAGVADLPPAITAEDILAAAGRG
jgi:hypothetical protein